MALAAEETAATSAADAAAATAEVHDSEAPSGEVEAAPPPDPNACIGIVICQHHLEQGILDGQWTNKPYMYYLEPAGVLQARLICSLCHSEEETEAGIFMTRDAWKAHVVHFDDGINQESYELSFPKEFGYVKPRSHYDPATREHAKYPWTKKY